MGAATRSQRIQQIVRRRGRGRFSVAAAYLATVLGWTQATPQIDLSQYPAVKAYLERPPNRPSVAAALGVEIPLFRAEIARQNAAWRAGRRRVGPLPPFRSPGAAAPRIHAATPLETGAPARAEVAK